jgi:hypothetical protein
MPDTPTPGQLAYETYVLHLYGDDQFPWPTLFPDAQAAWEAAAQAVLAWQRQGVDDTGFAPPGLYRQPPHKENTT